MEYVPKEITEDVNVTPIHPLRYLGKIGLILGFWGVVFYLVSGVIADQAAQMLGPDLEANIGKSLVTPFAASDVYPETEQQVQSLLDELQIQQQIRYPQAEIHLIESEVINAGVFPGGQMIMTTGLLKAAQSENELAFVLAHELGHHQLRHPSRRLGRSLLWMIILSFLGIGQHSSPDPSIPRLLADLSYSRSQEQQADRFALQVVQARYGHINHSLDFFQRLHDQSDDLSPVGPQIEFLATHPFPKSRISDLTTYAQRKNWPIEGSATSLELRELSD